jgi:hypothetical protein
VAGKNAQGVTLANSPVQNVETVTPEVLDLDISGADKVVNWPHASPQPVAIGQEVQLQASPAPNLSSTNWTFDYNYYPNSGFVDTFGSYSLLGPTPSPPLGPTAAVPSPVPTSANPVTFYWFGFESSGTGPFFRHLYLTAYAPNVNGPLVSDVFYPVVTTGYTGGNLAFQTASVGSDSVPNPTCSSAITVAWAVHLGIPCAPSNSASGVVGTFGVSAPASGYLAAAQLLYYTYSGASNGTPAPGYNTDPNGKYQLDTQFPAYGDETPVTGGGSATYTFTDSPFIDLDQTGCSSFQTIDKYATFIMYLPNPRVAGHPSAWVTATSIGEYHWGWSGAAHVLSNGNWKADALSSPSGWTNVQNSLPIWTTIPDTRDAIQLCKG